MAKTITMGRLIEASGSMPSDIGAIMVFAPNTYPFSLGLHGARNGIGELFRVHKDSGINFAQVSEDIFGFVPVAQYHKNPDPVNRLLDAMRGAADKSGVNPTSFGTGAELYTMWGQTGGVYDAPDLEVPMQTCRNYIDIAAGYPVPLICGHRVATVHPDNFGGCKLIDFADDDNLDIGGLDPDAILTGPELKNLELGLKLQMYGKGRGVSSTMELMYQPGMEPITIEQTRRAAIILKNAGLPVFIHMDSGHMVVGGKGKEPRDFDPMAYAKELGHFPYHTIHYCALDRNKHLMPTDENIQSDLEIKERRPHDVPHPEFYCDVRRYLDGLNRNGAKLIEISPEPKEVMDMTLLANSTRNVYEGLRKRYEQTHAEHPDFRGLLIPKAYLNAFQQNYG